MSIVRKLGAFIAVILISLIFLLGRIDSAVDLGIYHVFKEGIDKSVTSACIVALVMLIAGIIILVLIGRIENIVSFKVKLREMDISFVPFVE